MTDWIGQLPAEVAPQRAVLANLLHVCENDPDIAWLAIGCSFARGAADHLSDLDPAVGITGENAEAATIRIRDAVRGLGHLVDMFHHQIPGLTVAHERIFAQYADGCQLDLMVLPASIGSLRRVVVLYDPDDRLASNDTDQAVSPAEVREWAFRAWCALADLGKYLRRRSPWEALERLNEARHRLWQLHATAHHIADPQYGLTSVLDFGTGIPAGMEATVADLDQRRLLAAARELARRLVAVGDQLSPEQQAALPRAMARHVTSTLSHP